jgi:hypothetical protein
MIEWTGKETHMVPPPLSIGLTFCHSIIIEEGTRNLTLIGSFFDFYADDFPFTPDPFYVVTSLVGGHGEGELELTITRLETDQEVFSVHRRLSFPDRLTAVRVVFRSRDCVFSDAGAYVMTLLMDGEWVTQRRFEVSYKESSV